MNPNLPLMLQKLILMDVSTVLSLTWSLLNVQERKLRQEPKTCFIGKLALNKDLRDKVGIWMSIEFLGINQKAIRLRPWCR